MDIVLGILIYSGALLIPIIYCFATRFSGKATRLMLIGLGLQIFWSLTVWAFVYFSWRAGYQDAWMGWALLIPVNFVGLIYFVAVLIRSRFTK